MVEEEITPGAGAIMPEFALRLWGGGDWAAGGRHVYGWCCLQSVVDQIRALAGRPACWRWPWDIYLYTTLASLNKQERPALFFLKKKKRSATT